MLILDFLHFMLCFWEISIFLIWCFYIKLEYHLKSMVVLQSKINIIQYQLHKYHFIFQLLFVITSQEINKQDCHKNSLFYHHFQLVCLTQNQQVLCDQFNQVIYFQVSNLCIWFFSHASAQLQAKAQQCRIELHLR